MAVGKRLKDAGATHIMCINMEVGNTDPTTAAAAYPDGSGVTDHRSRDDDGSVDAKSRIAGAQKECDDRRHHRAAPPAPPPCSPRSTSWTQGTAEGHGDFR